MLLQGILGGSFDILYIVYMMASFILGLTIHELGHAYTAYRLGDYTAKSQGRLSLNPLNHIDPIGMLALLLLGFGWAKPVMMNPNNFKNYRDGILLTALAGPVSNFLLAILGALALKVDMPLELSRFVPVFVSINIVLASFNLLPFPPLDGFKIFGRVLPDSWYYKAELLEARYGFLILMGLLLTGVLSYIWTPVFYLLIDLVNLITFSNL